MAPKPPSPEDPNFKEIRRHPKFYIPGADLTFLVSPPSKRGYDGDSWLTPLKIGGILIRVHRYFFDRESRVFREQVLPVPEGKSPHGYTDSTAITIDVPLDAFVKFLGIFYNPTYTLFDLTVGDWTDILELAHTWEFGEVKRLVVRELEKHELEIIFRINLYQRYSVESTALIPLYTRLCMRDEPPNDEEADALGIKTTVRVYRARELLRTVPAITGGPAGGLPSTATRNKDKVLQVVNEVFRMETPASSPVDDKTGRLWRLTGRSFV
ncbi:hypothetical protein BDZ94DRAFT_637061 [Collybia nuda]|uniref:BTB domain-containing protein n=1 Tax=Collybia nuda TaxID=64659 RepID=A0A9P6CJZ2_9AGAR|nr:hypothetical protein BDZ94DRAFT_637061 [Collybia nuda]